MHLGNGAITPECALLTYGGAAAGLAVCATAARRAGLSRDKLLVTVGIGALVFAAQAVNVPVWPGISAHLVGGVLLAWTLGPGLGACGMGLILALQALLLGDGGLAALGANVLNMALVPAGLVAIARQRSLAVAGATAGLAVPLAACLIVVETALFRPAAELAGWSSFAAMMLGTHLGIGVLEAGLTVGLVAAIGWLTVPAAARPNVRLALCCVGVATVLSMAALPWSSDLPDGYEAAALASGQSALLSD